jgi:protein-S-isoprenylcysteine O-methyltransferase Ste14
MARCSGDRERRRSGGAPVSPPRVQAAWTITRAEGAVRAPLGAIVPEEQYLKAEFGAEYERYAARVRRWL